jgi:adenylylsulfate reductase, subunit A
MKATHEYGAGTATYYMTSSKNLEIVMDMLQTMREDCEKLAAGDLHELMRAWEIEHRIWTVEAHLRHIQFRKETRYPGFYYQADYPGQDDANWFCFRQLQVRSRRRNGMSSRKTTSRSSRNRTGCLLKDTKC